MISKVEVDIPSCIGCGTCWVVCPDAFREVEVGGDFKAESTGRLAEESQLRSAAEGCPSLSIALYDGSGGLVYPTAEQREELARRMAW